MLPQFYTGASKSSRIKPARQEPAVTGVIFKHLTVHETLKSCLAPSSIPARSSGGLRRRRSLLFPRQGGNGICPAAPRRHPRYLQQQDLGRTGSEHRGTAPHTHTHTGLTGGGHRALKGSWGRRGTNPPGTARSRGHLLQTPGSSVPLSLSGQERPADTERRRGRGRLRPAQEPLRGLGARRHRGCPRPCPGTPGTTTKPCKRLPREAQPGRAAAGPGSPRGAARTREGRSRTGTSRCGR